MPYGGKLLIYIHFQSYLVLYWIILKLLLLIRVIYTKLLTVFFYKFTKLICSNISRTDFNIIIPSPTEYLVNKLLIFWKGLIFFKSISPTLNPQFKIFHSYIKLLGYLQNNFSVWFCLHQTKHALKYHVIVSCCIHRQNCGVDIRNRFSLLCNKISSYKKL